MRFNKLFNTSLPRPSILHLFFLLLITFICCYRLKPSISIFYSYHLFNSFNSSSSSSVYSSTTLLTVTTSTAQLLPSIVRLTPSCRTPTRNKITLWMGEHISPFIEYHPLGSKETRLSLGRQRKRTLDPLRSW